MCLFLSRPERQVVLSLSRLSCAGTRQMWPLFILTAFLLGLALPLGSTRSLERTLSLFAAALEHNEKYQGACEKIDIDQDNGINEANKDTAALEEGYRCKPRQPLYHTEAKTKRCAKSKRFNYIAASGNTPRVEGCNNCYDCKFKKHEFLWFRCWEMSRSNENQYLGSFLYSSGDEKKCQDKCRAWVKDCYSLGSTWDFENREWDLTDVNPPAACLAKYEEAGSTCKTKVDDWWDYCKNKGTASGKTLMKEARKNCTKAPTTSTTTTTTTITPYAWEVCLGLEDDEWSLSRTCEVLIPKKPVLHERQKFLPSFG
ncbi:unnamed protein product [Amoebophrya sp. A120]|nr:unnamed protein product [Amoebophrya sp. A120]|eukprot:GSA120T00004552001.1